MIKKFTMSFWGKALNLEGGPFAKWNCEGLGVKMAEEIEHNCSFAVDVADFSVPSGMAIDQLRLALEHAVVASVRGGRVYAGCMGGTGRTGLFYACLAKALGKKDPVEFVRANYKPHAVETPEQRAFVENFDVSGLWWLAVKTRIKSFFGL